MRDKKLSNTQLNHSTFYAPVCVNRLIYKIGKEDTFYILFTTQIFINANVSQPEHEQFILLTYLLFLLLSNKFYLNIGTLKKK